VLSRPPLLDDHSVLVWQTCAYAEELGDAARSGARLTPPFDALLEFLRFRLLPYLRAEERQLTPPQLTDQDVRRLLLADHDRLRARVADLEAGRTRSMVVAACDGLVDGLDRHVRREERWLAAARRRAGTGAAS
jgi:hypothetical protein